jgi:hypothetical protein
VCDHQDDLLQGRLLRQALWATPDHADGFPFLLGEHDVTRQIRTLPPQFGQIQYPPSDDGIEGDEGLDAGVLLELEFLDLATALEDPVEDLDFPTDLIPLDEFHSLLKTLDRLAGEEGPVDRILSRGRVQAVEAVNAAPEFMVGRQWIASRREVDPVRLGDVGVPIKDV